MICQISMHNSQKQLEIAGLRSLMAHFIAAW